MPNNNLLHFPTQKNTSPKRKVDLYKKLSSIIKKNPNIKSPTQVWLFMSWFMNELFQTRSVKVNSEKLAQTLMCFYEEADKFYTDELNILYSENKENYDKILYKIFMSVSQEEDRQNSLGLAALLLYVYRNNL